MFKTKIWYFSKSKYLLKNLSVSKTLESLLSALERIVEKIKSAWGLIMTSTASSKAHYQLANTDNLESFFHQTLEVVCSMLVEVSYNKVLKFIFPILTL